MTLLWIQIFCDEVVSTGSWLTFSVPLSQIRRCYGRRLTLKRLNMNGLYSGIQPANVLWLKVQDESVRVITKIHNTNNLYQVSLSEKQQIKFERYKDTEVFNIEIKLEGLGTWKKMLKFSDLKVVANGMKTYIATSGSIDSGHNNVYFNTTNGVCIVNYASNEAVVVVGQIGRTALSNPSSTTVIIQNTNGRIGVKMLTNVNSVLGFGNVATFTSFGSSTETMLIQVKQNEITTTTQSNLSDGWKALQISPEVISTFNLNGTSALNVYSSSSGGTHYISVVNLSVMYASSLRYVRFAYKKSITTATLGLFLYYDDNTFEYFNFAVNVSSAIIGLVEVDLYTFSNYVNGRELRGIAISPFQTTSGSFTTIFSPIMLFSDTNDIIAPSSIQLGFEVGY